LSLLLFVHPFKFGVNCVTELEEKKAHVAVKKVIDSNDFDQPGQMMH
jgi:hypothetical protein